MIQTQKEKKGNAWNVKEWFIILGNEQLGPFSLADLKNEPKFNPDTLVWRKGLQEWVKARFVPEMQEVFKDQPESQAIHEPQKGKGLEGNLGQQSQVTLTLQQDPYQFLLWILLLLLVILYTIYQFYSQS
jgi:hypothetical protein